MQTTENNPVRRFTIALDFDGTVVTNAFPEIGQDVGAHPWLELITSQPDIDLILWTCRGAGQILEDAVQWFKDRNIPLAGINELESQKEWMTELGPKVYADIYVDDRALGFPRITLPNGQIIPDWTHLGTQICGEYEHWKREEIQKMAEQVKVPRLSLVSDPEVTH